MKKFAYALPALAAPNLTPNTAMAHPGNHDYMTSFTQAMDHLMGSPFHAGLSVIAISATAYGILTLRKRQRCQATSRK